MVRWLVGWLGGLVAGWLAGWLANFVCVAYRPSNPPYPGQPPQVLPLYYLSRNCSALDEGDVRVLQQLACGLQRALSLPLVCATMAPVWCAALEMSWAGLGCLVRFYFDCVC